MTTNEPSNALTDSLFWGNIYFTRFLNLYNAIKITPAVLIIGCNEYLNLHVYWMYPNFECNFCSPSELRFWLSYKKVLVSTTSSIRSTLQAHICPSSDIYIFYWNNHSFTHYVLLYVLPSYEVLNLHLNSFFV